jgi:hypothetical protein
MCFAAFHQITGFAIALAGLDDDGVSPGEP